MLLKGAYLQCTLFTVAAAATVVAAALIVAIVFIDAAATQVLLLCVLAQCCGIQADEGAALH
jgi:hypothetical protein